MTLSLSDSEKLAVADRYLKASRGGDREDFLAQWAPGATIWHNFDERNISPEQTAKTIAWLEKKVPDLGWSDVSLFATPDGFVSQQIMTGTAPGGALRVLSCVIVTLNDDGLVVRLEEYLDQAQTSVLSD
jgi:uncharacterized protein